MATAKTESPSSILSAIQQATQDDLDTIDKRITELKNELESLQEVRKVIQVRLHGKPTRKPPTRRPRIVDNPTDPGARGTIREPLTVEKMIYDLIANEGSGTAQQIATKLTVRGYVSSPQQVGVVCGKSDWFEKDEETGRWVIAKVRR